MGIEQIRTLAQSVGFDAVGVAPAHALREDEIYLQRWLEAGCNGSMSYMERHQDLRIDPRKLVPGCKTMIVCLLSYKKSCRQPDDAPYISQSGLSAVDYHIVVKDKLLRLEKLIGEDAFSNSHQHLFCDSAPVLERRWAVECGLGWIGKNHLFIHPTLGSYVHIGILMMNQALDTYTPHISEGFCGDCDRCLLACPTGAIRGDLFDARKCVSYLTIERKEPMPDKYQGKEYIGLYGCDRCQQACPFNIESPADLHPELAVNPAFLDMTAQDWTQLSRRQKIKLLHRLAN